MSAIRVYPEFWDTVSYNVLTRMYTPVDMNLIAKYKFFETILSSETLLKTLVYENNYYALQYINNEYLKISSDYNDSHEIINKNKMALNGYIAIK